MEKKLAFSVVADPHLSDKNISEVEAAMRLSIDKTAEKGVELLFVIGDIFTDRKTQSFNTMQAFTRILDYAHNKSVTLMCIPGNHDKIDYTSKNSYLDIYRWHPAMDLETGIGQITLDTGWTVFQLPYFREKDALLPYLEELNKIGIPRKSVLLTHLSIDGVRNNDGSEVSETLPRDTFKKFGKVLVGHYHDKQEFGNITYIGSLLQNNFGEDTNKGITYFYTDESMEQESLGESLFLTVDVDLNDTTKAKINKLVKDYADVKDKIRFRFEGSKEKFKNVPKSLIESKGIKVTFKEEKVETVAVDAEVADSFAAFTKTSILEEWDGYCEKDEERKGFHKEGKKILEETL